MPLLLKLAIFLFALSVFLRVLSRLPQPERLCAYLDTDAPEVRPVPGARLRFPDGAVEPQRTAVFLCGPREGGA